MPFYLLPSLLIQIFAVGYTPGPANLYALSCSMRFGRRAALKMWAGLACGFTVAAIAVAIAVHILEETLGDYVIWLKYLGAAYILYLAVRMIWDSGLNENTYKPCTFWNGFIVQLTNVKMILFDISVYSTFVLPYSDSLLDLIAMIPFLLIAGPGANFVWLAAGRVLHQVLKKYRKTVNLVLGLALAFCAVLILL